MKNSEYWKKRAEQNILNTDMIREDSVEKIKAVWEESVEKVKAEINHFYNKYYEKNVDILETIFSTLDKQELQEFNKKAKKYYEESRKKNWQELYQKQILNLSAKKSVKRLEELQMVLNHILQNNYEYEQLSFLDGLTKTYETSYNTSMYNLQTGLNVGVTFGKINKDTIKKILQTKWLGSNYSDRIWTDKKKLIKVLETQLQIGFASGENPRKIGKRIAEKMNTSVYNAERLARTEFLHIANEASFDSVKKLDEYLGSNLFTKYKFLATLDKRTSEDCQLLDGKVFLIKEKIIGVNFPPMHPNCRSTFTIISQNQTVGERIAKRLDTGEVEYVPADMTYTEWSKKFLK